MEIKTYTPVCQKFVFKKILHIRENFYKVLHCIQHNFIGQGPGLSNDGTSMFKSFFNNEILWSQILKHF